MPPFEILLLGGMLIGATALPPSGRHRDFEKSQIRVGLASDVSPFDKYQCFHGNIANYPREDQWLSFDEMWNVNHEAILSNNGGDVYVDHWIREGILQVSYRGNVDPRFILALVMQDSHGKATGHCTRPKSKCGLLHESLPDDNDEKHLQPLFDPLDPEVSIFHMLHAGINGARGYASYLFASESEHNDHADGNPWIAARKFSSGGAASEEDLDRALGRGQTSYVNDLANRLLGWKGRGKGFELCQR